MFAVAVTLAMPAAFEDAVVNVFPYGNVALAPVCGAEKFMYALGTGFPEESRTVTCKGIGKVVPTGADCEAPPEAKTILMVVLDKEKDADCPPALAVTV